MKKKYRIGIILLLLVLFVILKFPEWFSASQLSTNQEVAYRNTKDLILTRHVRCRMGCREVTLEEIKEIIEKGRVNRQKSGIGKQGDSTFALEGISQEKQHLRVVVAPQKNGELVVITCIDLEKEWPCNCN